MLFVAALVVLALPAAALARKPVISYVDEKHAFRLYDAELGKELTPPPVPVPDPAVFPQFRWGMSQNGRYIVFNDANKRLHLLDRATNKQLPLPGIDIDANSDGAVDDNPGSLTVSNNGLVGFDKNGNGPARVYSSAGRKFIATGLDADPANPANGHRQTKLSGDGRFLATTCGPSGGCIVDLGTDSNPYVQDLTTKKDVGIPDDNAKDEEHPCISGNGSLVGWDKQFPGATQRDVFLYNRSSAAFVTLTGLNDAAKEDAYCVLDSAGDYVGHLFDNTTFRVYRRSDGTFLTLPADKEFDQRSTFSAPYTPPRGGGGGGGSGAPVLSAVSMLRRVFAVAAARTPVVARRRVKRGSAFRYTLSEPATVRIQIQRRRAGRRVGRRCRKPTRHNRARRLCVRYVRAGTLTRRNRPAGKNTTRFSGRIGKRALKPGRYRALITAIDAAGNRSSPRPVTFRIVRVRRR